MTDCVDLPLNIKSTYLPILEIGMPLASYLPEQQAVHESKWLTDWLPDPHPCWPWETFPRQKIAR